MTSPSASEISNLSVFTVDSFLQEHPDHKKKALFIKDHNFPNLFFGASGVETIPFHSVSTSQPSSDAIKLYEFATAETLYKFIGDPHTDRTNISQLDSSSFIFVRTTTDNWDVCQEIHQYLDEFCRARCHFGIASRFTEDSCFVIAYSKKWFRYPAQSPVNPNAPEWVVSGLFANEDEEHYLQGFFWGGKEYSDEDGIEEDDLEQDFDEEGIAEDDSEQDSEEEGIEEDEGDDSEQGSEEEDSDKETDPANGLVLSEGLTLGGTAKLFDLDLSRLYSLRLENVQDLSGVSFPELRELTLVTRAQLNGSAPSISSICAPELRRFVIYYNSGLFPTIHKFTGWVPKPSVKRKYLINEDNKRTVEIVNVNVVSHEKTMDQPIIDHNFFLNFDVIHLYGTPLSVLYTCDMTKVSHLRLHIYESQNLLISKFIRMPLLENVHLQVEAANVTLPRILTRNLRSIALFIHNSEVDISNMWFLHTEVALSSLYIYNSIQLLKIGHQPLKIKYRDILLLSGWTIKNSWKISFIGVQIYPMTTNGSLTFVPTCLLFSREFMHGCKLVYRPVVRVAVGSGDNDCQVVVFVNTSGSEASVSSFDKLQLSPLFVDGVDGLLLPNQKCISLLPDFLAPARKWVSSRFPM